MRRVMPNILIPGLLHTLESYYDGYMLQRPWTTCTSQHVTRTSPVLFSFYIRPDHVLLMLMSCLTRILFIHFESITAMNGIEKCRPWKIIQTTTWFRLVGLLSVLFMDKLIEFVFIKLLRKRIYVCTLDLFWSISKSLRCEFHGADFIVALKSVLLKHRWSPYPRKFVHAFRCLMIMKKFIKFETFLHISNVEKNYVESIF